MHRILRLVAVGLLLALAGLAAAAAQDPAALYQRALADFYAERYDVAESAFSTVYRLAPEQRFAPDAAFKAGEAAFRDERYDAAIQHFGHCLRTYPLSPFAREAEQRLRQAREKAGPDARPLPLPDVRQVWARPLVAWFETLPVRENEPLDRLLLAVRGAGYNAVAVNAYKELDGPTLFSQPKNACVAGAYFATDAAPVCADSMAELVVAAHKAQLKLIAVLPIRGLGTGPEEAHADRRWDAFNRRPAPDPNHLDLWQPAATERLEALARDLARSGPDAIWLGRNLGFVPDEGLSDGALERASQALGEPLDLEKMFHQMPLGAGGRIRAGVTDPAYTAWCETRAARLVEAVATVKKAIRQVHPSCRLGVVLPATAVQDPVAGLRDRSLDVDALVAAPDVDAVVDLEMRAWKLTGGVTDDSLDDSLAALSKRVAKLAGKPDRVIVILRAEAAGGAWRLPPEDLKRRVGSLMTAAKFGLALSPPLAGVAVNELVETTP